MADQQYYEQAAASPTAQAQLNIPASGRPRVLLRTHSSPVATVTHAGGQQQHQQQPQSSLSRPSTPSTAASYALGLGIETDERAGSPRRLATNGFLQTNNDSEYEVNIAVVGSVGVGKSSFIQHSLGLASRPTAAVNARRISLDSGTYLVRMLECQLQDVHVDKDNRISWPLDPRMPSVDAACTLYDVSNKDTFEEVPVVLSE